MSDTWWIWCLLVTIGLGGCIGSFMNVVIYRLPRDIPLGRPRWSFCPGCRQTIRWYDNIPVVSYFRLDGRCRSCRWPIPPRYVVVEAVTLLAFLILFDAFFVSDVLYGLTDRSWPIFSRFTADWPIYVAHAVLFACLLGMSVIDLEFYWVDIRCTSLAALCGFTAHAVWAPADRGIQTLSEVAGSRILDWPRPGPTFAAAALLAAAGAVLTHWTMNWYWRRHPPPAEQAADPGGRQGGPGEGPDPEPGPGRPAGTFPPSAWLAGLTLYLSLALLVVEILRSGTAAPEPGDVLASAVRGPNAGFLLRAGAGLLFVLVAMVAGGGVARESDQQIAEALEAERHGARRQALLELLLLLPAAALLVLGAWLTWPGAALEGPWERVLEWRLGAARPLLGVATAAAGFVVAGAIGWTVRILFTVLLGKEAFGTGDIHIMAAAGAVAGWQVVASGFLVACVMALAGWLVTLPFKRGRTLPLGPWLTLAFFLMVLVREPMIREFVEPMEYVLRTLAAHFL